MPFLCIFNVKRKKKENEQETSHSSLLYVFVHYFRERPSAKGPLLRLLIQITKRIDYGILQDLVFSIIYNSETSNKCHARC